MKKFTDGPWIKIGGVIKSICGSRKVADIKITDTEGLCNALLITRSPEMYAALEKILFRCKSFLDDERDMSQDSIAVIAMICTKELKKARGEE